MNVSKLHVCPVCGKLPKAKRNIFGKTTIQCKPLFGRHHVKVEVQHADFCNPNSEAIETWNRAAFVCAKS